MSEAYVISAAAAPGMDGAAAWRALGEAAGVSLQRVQQVFLLGAGLEPLLDQNGTAACFAWPGEPLQAHGLLHAAARAIEQGDCELLAWFQAEEAQVSALLLGAPVAVGRYNLLPRARLGRKLALRGGPGGLLAAARARLDAETAGGITWLAGSEPTPAAGAFPAARWLETGPDLSLTGALIHLAGRLEAEKAAAGLLLSAGLLDSGLATVVERL